MEKQGCYFWLDMNIPEEERGMSVMCEACHEKHPDLGWYWPGWKGFGPYDIICNMPDCDVPGGRIIHLGATNNRELYEQNTTSI